MLQSILIIFLYQLVGEVFQKYFDLVIPGPVIGLILFFITLILLKKIRSKPIQISKENLIKTSNQIISYLPLLFIPIGVGVIMHINYIGKNILQILAVIFLSTIITLVITAKLMEKINKDMKSKK
jgi:holin-like protein